MKKRGDEPHLKVNGEAVAFVNEVEAATSQMASEIETLAASVSAMASTVENVSASVSALGSSVSAMTSSVQTLGSSVNVLTSNVTAIDASVSALGSNISAVGASVSAMASAIDLTNSHVSAIESAMGDVSASVSSLESSVETIGSSVDAVTSQVSAMASTIADKRDYDDLTYNITTPAEALDISKFSDPWDIDATYAAKLTFTLSGTADPITLTYDNGRWWNDNYAVPGVGFAQFYSLDPSDGMFVLYGNVGGNIIQFNLEDGTNTQVFNFTSQEYPSFTTLTMTFNGDAGHTISDNLALESQLSAYATSAWVVDYVNDQISAALDAQL